MNIIQSSTTKRKSVQAKTPLHFRNARHKEPSRTIGLTRPSILGKMPLSCNILFDVLRTLDPGNGVVQISQRDLAAITRYSQRQVGRALRRLRSANLLRLVDKGRGQRKTIWYLRWNNQKSFPQFSEALTTREENKERNPTKEKPLPSINLFKNTPQNLHLTARDKRKLSFIARKTCETASPILDLLWLRDPVASVWLDAIQGLQGLTIQAPLEELVWRSRKAIAALIGGVTVDKYQAIMLDKPATEQEAVQRKLGEIKRRLAGLERWRDLQRGSEHLSWFVEKRAELRRQGYEAERGLCTVVSETVKEDSEPRRPRGRMFHVSGFYSGIRQPLEGDALRTRKALAVKALRGTGKECSTVFRHSV